MYNELIDIFTTRGIELGLKTMCHKLGTEFKLHYILLYQNNENSDLVHAWVNPNSPVSFEVELNTFTKKQITRWSTILYNKEVIQERMDNLPPDEIAILSIMPCEYITIFPIFTNGLWWGFMILGGDGPLPTKEDVIGMKIVLGVYGTLLKRQMIEEELKKYQGERFWDTFMKELRGSD